MNTQTATNNATTATPAAATSKGTKKAKPAKTAATLDQLTAAMQDVVSTNAATEVGIIQTFQLAQKIGTLAAAKQVMQWVTDIHKSVAGNSNVKRATITHTVAVYAAQCVYGCEFYIGKGKNAERLTIGQITPENCADITLRSIDGEQTGFKAPTKKSGETTITWQATSYNRKPNGWNTTGGANTASYDVDNAVKAMAKKANTKGFANDLLNPVALATAISAGTDIEATEIKAAWLEVMLAELSLADIKAAKKQADELYGPQH